MLNRSAWGLRGRNPVSSDSELGECQILRRRRERAALPAFPGLQDDATAAGIADSDLPVGVGLPKWVGGTGLGEPDEEAEVGGTRPTRPGRRHRRRTVRLRKDGLHLYALGSKFSP